MSAGVRLDIGSGEPDATPLDVPGGQLTGVDGLIHTPGVHTEYLGGLADPYQLPLILTTHTSSMYLILDR